MLPRIVLICSLGLTTLGCGSDTPRNGTNDDACPRCQASYCPSQFIECMKSTNAASCAAVGNCVNGCADIDCANACVATGNRSTPAGQAALGLLECTSNAPCGSSCLKFKL